MNVLSCGQKLQTVSGISDAISPRYIRKNPRSMNARVLHEMAQFVVKIEKLCHIIRTAPILEMARSYGLCPRLWLLGGNISPQRSNCDIFGLTDTVALFTDEARFFKI